MNTVLDLVNELETLQAQWSDKLIVMIENDNYKFGIDINSIYTEVLNNAVYFDIADADAQEDSQIIDTIQDLKAWISDNHKIHSKNIAEFPINFTAAELNGDPDINISGWKSIEKNGNQIVITVSKSLKTW